MRDVVQVNKLLILGKLTASLVHEIRNPLSAIKLNLDYLNIARDDLPTDLKEIVSESLDAFDQVSFLIEDILNFTRKPSEKVHQVNLDNIIDRCLKIISFNARMNGVEIEKEIEEELPDLSFNKNKLMQIILNLLNNAIEASHNNSKIIIRAYKNCYEKNNFVLLEIQDFGVGIKPEDKEKMLTDFYTTKKQGHGIGISVCKKLAEELNAELFFDSSYGQGTTFSMKFKIE
jgi:signal transduction histidine kinase